MVGTVSKVKFWKAASVIRLGCGEALSMARAVEDGEGGNNGRQGRGKVRELRIKRALESLSESRVWSESATSTVWKARGTPSLVSMT